MLAQIGVNSFSFQFSTIGATPAVSPGTSVIPGASNAEGSWTEIASAANIAQNVYGLSLRVFNGFTSTQQKDHLLDIGIDPAGGTSYVPAHLPQNIVCGESGGNGFAFYFPVWILAGSAVAVRVQGNNATAGTVIVLATFYGQPSHPELIRVGQYSETIGTITNSQGVAFTPGNTGAEGTWTLLGVTTKNLWHWQLCVQEANTAMAILHYHFDLAFGDASNKVPIIQDLRCTTDSSESINNNYPTKNLEPCFADVPAGTNIYVRGTCSGTTGAGWNAVSVGIGG